MVEEAIEVIMPKKTGQEFVWTDEVELLLNDYKSKKQQILLTENL